MTDENAPDGKKAVASVQGTKMLIDLATKFAGEKSAAEYIKANTIKGIGGKLALKEGAKLTGKQVGGAVAGGALGAHTMVTEFGEAGEAWEEKDYDEALLHGIGSVSGGLQTAGAGLMVSGIGAPLGAILYGVGTAASVISSAGLFLENVFGGKDDPEEERKQKFDMGRYFDSIRQGRRYY